MKRRTGSVVLGAFLLGAGLVAAGLSAAGTEVAQFRPFSGAAAGSPAAAVPAQGAGWTVGELRPNGLRIVPSGRSDSSAVLEQLFSDPKVRRAYWIATQIPGLLNQLYCWCGCEDRGVHRSNLQCFEDRMGADCDVCIGTAEIAYDLVQNGISHPGKIQAAVDARWGPQAGGRT